MPDNVNGSSSSRIAAHLRDLRSLYDEIPLDTTNNTTSRMGRHLNRLRLDLHQTLEAFEALEAASISRVSATVPPQSIQTSPPNGHSAVLPYISQSSRLIPPAGFSHVTENTFGLASGSAVGAGLQQPPTLRPKTTKGPVVTLVSTLPPTTYREQGDSKANLNNLAYVRVQCALLSYLEYHAADSLTPRQARKWTEEIDSAANKEPKAADALRLCYYMRSQGYDVFGLIKNSAILLYRRAHGGDQDVLYWKQNFTTNRVEYAVPTPRRDLRRNAVVAVGSNTTDDQTGFQRQAERSADLAAAEARLQVQLARQPSDTALIDALLHQIDLLRAQNAVENART